MAIGELVTELGTIVFPMLLITILVVIGLRRLETTLRTMRRRVLAVSIPLLLLVIVILIRVLTRDFLGELSWELIGVHFTSRIYSFELTVFATNPVTVLQSFESTVLTSYFVFIYLYGYVFLLVFPIIAYISLPSMDDLKTLLIAFTTNYSIGLVLYTLFIAYGPRNYDPILFEDILYLTFPQSRYLTDWVNESTNVFPSLHTSMAITVLIMAWQTRREYPLWVPIAAVLSVSVVIATMYLGIHWFTDVVAGVVLAAGSVYVGRRYTKSDIDDSVRDILREQFGHVKTTLGM